jgi:ADP-heptose:LPS heptosyltransferase
MDRPSGLVSFSGFAKQRKIAVFRALQLGDLLCSVPALRALRAAAPHAHITLIGLPWAASFAKRYDKYIDAHASFPGFPGLPEHPVDIGQIPGFIAAMQQQRFDVMLQMHGSGVLTNPLTMSFGAAHYAGFYLEGNYCPDPQHFMRWDEQQHEVTRNLQLMEFLGAPAQGEDLEFPLTEQDYRALQACDDLPAPGTYVCIHPGARMLSRRWKAERFAEVADRLQEGGLRVVLTGASQEADLARQVARAMRTQALSMVGKTDLGAFAALVANARLVVCNDTGISHIAAAVRAPSVVVCSGADPKRWAPLNARRHRVVFADVPCRPCAHQVCPIGHPCADRVGVDMVLAAARQVLADNPFSCPPARAFRQAREVRMGA